MSTMTAIGLSLLLVVLETLDLRDQLVLTALRDPRVPLVPTLLLQALQVLQALKERLDQQAPPVLRVLTDM